jgi:hypothetical protein
MDDLIERENLIFEILKRFTNQNMDFVVIGGYAVSSYKHRFSTDADIVINKEKLPLFEEILKKQGFSKTKNRELESFYSPSFVRYEKDLVSIDLMVGALASRQTGAEFSFDFLLKHSSRRKIIGIENEITVLVPRKEILIITKIHSARLTDFRDIAALAEGIDLEFLRENLFRGDKNVILENLKKLKETTDSSNFRDAFKGMFMEKDFKVNFEDVRKISLIKP